MDKETIPLGEQDLKDLTLLKELYNTEKFQVWIKKSIEPQINRLELELDNCDGMSRSDILVKVKLRMILKQMFINVFQNVQILLEEEQKHK
jgi:hypothetical protein